MKLIIAGTRTASVEDLEQAVILYRDVIKRASEIVSGGARGTDTHGFDWAWANGIPVKSFVANWAKYGKKAGPFRNMEMAKYADELLAVWDGKSRGTQHMLRVMKVYGKPIHLYGIGDFKGIYTFKDDAYYPLSDVKPQ